MADYGDIKTWHTVFRGDSWPNYWWTTNIYSPPATRVPKEMLGLLDAMVDDFVERNRKYYLEKWGEYGSPAKKITFDENTNEYVLHGYNLFWNTEKTEEWLMNNGFEKLVENNRIRHTPDPTLFDMDNIDSNSK